MVPLAETIFKVLRKDSLLDGSLRMADKKNAKSHQTPSVLERFRVVWRSEKETEKR
jgi:hypothetical protein